MLAHIKNGYNENAITNKILTLLKYLWISEVSEYFGIISNSNNDVLENKKNI